MSWTSEKFPRLVGPLADLVKQHRELAGEPLHLALSFDPGRDEGDIFLFELLGHFASGQINPDRELLEGSFESSRRLPMESGQSLHLILTHFEELRVALAEGWPSAEEIRTSVLRGDFEILFEDEIGRQAMDLLRG